MECPLSARTRPSPPRGIVIGALVAAALCLAPAAWGEPAVRLSNPTPIDVVVGAAPVPLSLIGQRLEQIDRCAVVRDGEEVRGVVARPLRLAPPVGARNWEQTVDGATKRSVELYAAQGTVPGPALLRIVYGTSSVELPSSTALIRIVASTSSRQTLRPVNGLSSQPPSASVGQGGGRIVQGGKSLRPAAAGRGTSPGGRPAGFAQMAAYPGTRPLRVAAKGLPRGKITGVRAYREGGGAARSIDTRLVTGPGGAPMIETIVRAGAVAGRYGMEFLVNGRWNSVPGGILGLTVLNPKGGVTPLGAVTGIISGTGVGGARGTAGIPGAGGFQPGVPGSRVGRENVGQPFGLGGVSAPKKDGLPTGSRRLGDSRLMADGDPGADGDAGADTEGGDSGGSNQQGGDTVGVVSESTDVESSDGSQTVTDTVTTSDDKGNFFSDTITSTRDKNGNVTQTRSTILRDSSGKVTEEGSCTGYDCTPNPTKDSGCTGKDCKRFAENMKQMAPLVAAMRKRSEDAKWGSLKGDQRGDGSYSGSRSPADARSGGGLPAPTDFAVDPNPEKGGSSGGDQGHFGPLIQPSRRIQLKDTLPDPGVAGDPARTGPTLPGAVRPDAPGGGGGTPEGSGTGNAPQ